MTTAGRIARIEGSRVHDKDTGSCEVQVALLTDRISELTEHLKLHPKDHSTRHGLRKLVGQRTRLLKYLQETEVTRYESLIAKLDIRGVRVGA